MAKHKCTIDELDREVLKIIDKYGDDLKWNVVKAARKVARKGREALSQLSKQFDTRWGKGRYSSGWRVKEEIDKWGTTEIIYQWKQPSLTHLLEEGHALWQGGRAKAYPHISVVAEKLPDDFSAECIQAIREASK